MRGRRPLTALALTGAATMLSACGGASTPGTPKPVAPTAAPAPTATPATSSAGDVSVSGNRLLRDGKPWIPHGVQFIAFVASPDAWSTTDADAPWFQAAYQHFSTAELDDAKAWGADSVRMQLSQPGADPEDPEYSASFVAQFVAGVNYARSIGLDVFVSIQDETQSGQTGGTSPLPDAATNRVWASIAPMLLGDDGIVFEMYNEPELNAPPGSDVNTVAQWQQFDAAMNATIQVIRSTGATNALLADGLQEGTTLQGLIPVTDPDNDVFYSVHPYFHDAADQNGTNWAARFGNAAAQYPVIAGEWTTLAGGYCNGLTPAAAVKFLQYIQSLNIGLVAVSYDWVKTGLGGIVSGYDAVVPNSPSITTYVGGQTCGTPNFGPGRTIQSWYLTSVVPASPL